MKDNEIIETSWMQHIIYVHFILNITGIAFFQRARYQTEFYILITACFRSFTGYFKVFIRCPIRFTFQVYVIRTSDFNNSFIHVVSTLHSILYYVRYYNDIFKVCLY